MKPSRPRGGTLGARLATAAPVPGPGTAYFFDIDGTLLDIAGSPDGVRLDREFRHLIEGLYHASGGAVALISGRAIADIDRLFPERQWPAAGQHGLERRDAEGRVFRLAAASPEPLVWARSRLAEIVERHPDLMVEDKGLSLALHYRQAPRLGGMAHRVMRSLQARLGPGHCVLTGKRVVELKPAGADKGAATLAFMGEPPFRGRVPIFIGDDATDEHGFAMVNQLGGHSVKVGRGNTVARWRLASVRAVWAWLERGMQLHESPAASAAETAP